MKKSNVNLCSPITIRQNAGAEPQQHAADYRVHLAGMHGGCMMQRNTKILCPVCEKLVMLDGTTNGRGELIMPWHLRENWKRCEGSYRSREAVNRLGDRVKRIGFRGDQL